jgi:sulfur carrier protein
MHHTAMRIVYNGTDTEIVKECTLLLYLQDEGLAAKSGIAVAVNESVVPRNQWPATVLKPNDSIIVIKATQGG